MTKGIKENKVSVKFYKKASFPWAIIILATAVLGGFIAGTHVERLSQQTLDQQFANGVASVKTNQK